MRRTLGWLITAALLASCAAAPKSEAPDAPLPFKKDGIRLDVKAGPDLNTYNEQSHTLVMVVFQLEDPNKFNQLLQDPNGVAKLFDPAGFEGGALGRKQLVVQPGEESKVYLDRAKGARYLGLVAGYYRTDSKTSGRLLPLKILRSTSFMAAKGQPEPAESLVKLNLGREGITDAITVEERK